MVREVRYVNASMGEMYTGRTLDRAAKVRFEIEPTLIGSYPASWLSGIISDHSISFLFSSSFEGRYSWYWEA